MNSNKSLFFAFPTVPYIILGNERKIYYTYYAYLTYNMHILSRPIKFEVTYSMVLNKRWCLISHYANLGHNISKSHVRNKSHGWINNSNVPSKFV